MAKNKLKIGREAGERISEVLKAVGHPVRISIVELLEKREMCVGDIVEAVGGKQAIISQQLRLMKDRGVLGCRRERNKVYYYLSNPSVIKLLHCMYDHCNGVKRR